MSIKRLSASVMLLSGSLLSIAGYADFLPYSPRASITGTGGDHAMTQADVLLPILGNTTELWYGDVQSRYGEGNSWSGSLGTGYRRLINHAIWGGGLFVDRNHSAFGNNFWTLSPSLEKLGEIWDFRVNGYIPVGKKHWQGAWSAANELGIKDYFRAYGHTITDKLVAPIQEAGKGLEAEAAYHVHQLPGLTLAGGAYHYHYIDTNDISGISARLEYAISPSLGLVLSDNYDKERHNQLAIGIKLTLGANVSDKPTLVQRFTEEVKRGFGTLNQGTLVPMQQGLVFGRQQMLNDNVWFFKPNTGDSHGLADGTAEHPFVDIEQTNIEQAGNDAWLYVESGNYGQDNSNLALLSGQRLYGRTQNYALAATNDKRPILNTSFTIDNQDDILIDSIKLIKNTNYSNFGLNIINSDHILIKNTAIEVTKTDFIDINVIGILSMNSRLDIENSAIKVYNALGSEATRTKGLSIINGHLGLKNSTLLVHSKSNYAHSDGISLSYQDNIRPTADINNELKIENSTITTEALGSSYGFASGIDFVSQTTPVLLVINDSTINAFATSDAESGMSMSYGLRGNSGLQHGKPSMLELQMHNNKINVGASAYNQATAYGLHLDGFNQSANRLINLQNNQFSVYATTQQEEAYSTGLYLQGVAATIINNKINSEARGENDAQIIEAVGIASDHLAESIIVDNEIKPEGHNAIIEI